jgi:hypothetical protein
VRQVLPAPLSRNYPVTLVRGQQPHCPGSHESASSAARANGRALICLLTLVSKTREERLLVIEIALEWLDLREQKVPPVRRLPFRLISSVSRINSSSISRTKSLPNVECPTRRRDSRYFASEAAVGVSTRPFNIRIVHNNRGAFFISTSSEASRPHASLVKVPGSDKMRITWLLKVPLGRKASI